MRFPEVAHNVVHLLMDFLGGDGALPVIEFVREIVEARGAGKQGVGGGHVGLLPLSRRRTLRCARASSPSSATLFRMCPRQTSSASRCGCSGSTGGRGGENRVRCVGATRTAPPRTPTLSLCSESDEEVQAALRSVRECLGPLPLTTPWETFMAQARSRGRGTGGAGV